MDLGFTLFEMCWGLGFRGVARQQGSENRAFLRRTLQFRAWGLVVGFLPQIVKGAADRKEL